MDSVPQKYLKMPLEIRSKVGMGALEVLQGGAPGRAMNEGTRLGATQLALGVVREPESGLALLRPLAIGDG